MYIYVYILVYSFKIFTEKISVSKINGNIKSKNFEFFLKFRRTASVNFEDITFLRVYV